MTFDELWVEIEKLHILPDAAISQVPHVLSEYSKRMLARRTPNEAVRIIEEVVDEIDNGSVQTVDSLVMKKLNRRKT